MVSKKISFSSYWSFFWEIRLLYHDFKVSLSALDPREKCITTSRSSSLTPVEERPEPLNSDEKPLGTVALSTRQLVLRRGATVLLMFVILAAGVIISEVLIRLLEKWLNNECITKQTSLPLGVYVTCIIVKHILKTSLTFIKGCCDVLSAPTIWSN